MNIDSIQNGVVLDHIQAGKSMDIYKYLHLDELDCSVAIIKNVRSDRMGKKDIIKIDSPMEVDLDVLGYIDPNITVNIIRNGQQGCQEAPGAAPEAGEHHPLQEPPLHHRGGAPAGRHLPAQRLRQAHLSLRLLRHGKAAQAVRSRRQTAAVRMGGGFFLPARAAPLFPAMTDAGFPLHHAHPAAPAPDSPSAFQAFCML